jgi:hypothetical protein
LSVGDGIQESSEVPLFLFEHGNLFACREQLLLVCMYCSWISQELHTLLEDEVLDLLCGEWQGIAENA